MIEEVETDDYDYIPECHEKPMWYLGDEYTGELYKCEKCGKLIIVHNSKHT